jgi:hypothetical protein
MVAAPALDLLPVAVAGASICADDAKLSDNPHAISSPFDPAPAKEVTESQGVSSTWPIWLQSRESENSLMRLQTDHINIYHNHQ